MTQAVTHLAYLHGFRSSPQSTKATRMAEWVAQHRPAATWWCPQLPVSPAAALDLVLERTQAWPRATMAVMGSSLGGYYATIVAERTGCRAVLLNPAIEPARDLESAVGQATTTWHGGEPFDFRAEHVGELAAMAPPRHLTHPERLLAVIAKGDELLSWREMSGRYPGSRLVVVDGSDHALSDFDDHLPEIVRFLGWT